MASSAGSRAQAEKVIARCRTLAKFTEEPGRITRTFLSPPMRECHREIASWVEPLGAEVRIDAAGNFRAFCAGAEAGAPKLVIGSHLDTVPDAGAFDGVMGVVMGVVLLENLRGERLPFGIEVVGFSEEEGVRFNTPFIGSRALVGTLDEEILARRDAHGVSVREAIEKFGLKPGEIPDARLRGEILGYVEFHVEQGPVLEELGLPLGVVEGLAGQSKMEFVFTGRANHAGTTPMRLRRDAVAGAAEWITAVEREAERVPGLVATVGAVEVKPGATNVIAGEARASLDLRHRADDVRDAAVETVVRFAEQIAERRGLTVRHETKASQPAVGTDARLVDEIAEAIRRAGCAPHRMVSGAGHDAMILAEKFPAAMMFVRSPGGISHSPEESVWVEDVAKAIEAGAFLLEALASKKVSSAHEGK